MGNIIESKEKVSGMPPKTIREVGLERIMCREIGSWCGHHGSYGMGGPGFFGIELNETKKYGKENLILTLWGACQWLLLDDHWVEAHPDYYAFKNPLSSNYGGDMEWDGVSELLVGGTIVNVEIDTNYSAFEIFNAGVKHLLELPSETNRLPIYGIGNEREWDKTENVIDAWVVTNELLLV